MPRPSAAGGAAWPALLLAGCGANRRAAVRRRRPRRPPWAAGRARSGCLGLRRRRPARRRHAGAVARARVPLLALPSGGGEPAVRRSRPTPSASSASASSSRRPWRSCGVARRPYAGSPSRWDPGERTTAIAAATQGAHGRRGQRACRRRRLGPRRTAPGPPPARPPGRLAGRHGDDRGGRGRTAGSSRAAIATTPARRGVGGRVAVRRRPQLAGRGGVTRVFAGGRIVGHGRARGHARRRGHRRRPDVRPGGRVGLAAGRGGAPRSPIPAARCAP